jgi:N-acetylneuraminate synthase
MLGENNKIAIIAEIGINHNGDIDVAKKLIDLAADSGCDAVKFQKRTIDTVYTKEELDKFRESPWGTTNREQKYGLEFTKAEYDEIDRYCKTKGIDWSASAWDLESQRFLQQYDLKFNKVASALLTYDKLLHVIAREGKHTYVSTGMSQLEQVDHAVEIFVKYDCPFTIMHCTSTYPNDVSECNVRCIGTLQERYPDSIGIGYSGHEKGILPSLLAVSEGATVIERHITLDRTMYGSDQAASLEPAGLRRLCRDVHTVHAILGDGVKKVYDSEKPIIKKLRKY